MRGVARLFVSFLICSASLRAQFDWPMVDGGPTRRSWAENETALRPPFAFSYLYGKSEDASNLSCVGNLLMAGQARSPNAVVALGFLTRDSLWAFQIPNSGGAIDNTPAIAGGLVIVGGQNSPGLFALDKATGYPVWSSPVGNLYNRHPIVKDDRVYVNGDSIFCLVLSTGKTVWALGGVSWQSTPSVDDLYAYLDGPGITFAARKETGEVVWTVNGTQAQGLAVDEGCVYTNRAGQVIAVNKTDGTIKWIYTIPGGASLPHIDGDAIALSDRHLCAVLWENSEGKGEVFALDKSTGAFLWRSVFPTPGMFSPTIANGIVYTTKYPEGTLLAHDAATGAILLSDNSRYYHDQPIVANHSLIVPVDGGIIALRNSPLSAVEDIPSPVPQSSPAIEMVYPNPVFTGSDAVATILFSSTKRSPARLSVHDLFGRQCALLLAEDRDAGSHRVTWRPANLPAGVYFYRLEVEGKVLVRRIVLSK